MWDVVLLLLVPFQSQTFDVFSTSFWTYTVVILPYFNAISVDFYAVKCLHLFCVISMFVNGRMFGHICPGADPGQGKIGGGASSSKNFFFGPEGYSNKPNS